MRDLRQGRGPSARSVRIPRLKPDLVLMDIQLGEALSGIDAATRLRPSWTSPSCS
jgi:CheY-like chemotaxis protein